MIEDLEKKFIELVRKPHKSETDLIEKERLRKELEFQLRKETEYLTIKLKEVGVECSDVWDLVNSKNVYPEAIDILITYLSEPYHDKNKEGIVRALTVKEAKGKAAGPLIIEYEQTPKEKENLRWVIGNALATTMTLKDVDWVFETVLNKTNGRSRGQLVLALGTVKTEQSEDVLIDLLNDDEVAPQALSALGKLKSQKAKAKIVKMRESEDSLIRLEATKALKKIR